MILKALTMREHHNMCFMRKQAKMILKNNFLSGITNAEGYASRSARPYEQIANMPHILMKTGLGYSLEFSH